MKQVNARYRALSSRSKLQSLDGVFRELLKYRVRSVLMQASNKASAALGQSRSLTNQAILSHASSRFGLGAYGLDNFACPPFAYFGPMSA
jgi:hypothetical protein